MCLPCDDGISESTVSTSAPKMERAMVIKKDVVNPRRLEYLAVWGGPIVELNGIHESLRKYYEKMARVPGKRYGTIDVTYEIKSQRLFATGLSLQSMPSVVRNFIVDDRAMDIDIINAAPTIIQQVCKINNIETPCLDHFNLHYKRLLREMNVSDVKKVKAFIFFGSVARQDCDLLDVGDNGGIGVEPGWLSALQTELAEVVVERLKTIPAYSGLYSEAIVRDRTKSQEHEANKRRRRNGGGDYVTNVKGIFMSLLYFMEETSILKCIDQIGRRLNLWDNRVSMVFDGMVVFPKSEAPISLADLDMISNMAFQETGIRVRLIVKPMDRKLQLDIDKFPEEKVVLCHHREAADMMMYLLGEDVCRDGSVAYIKRDGIWTSNIVEVNKFLLDKVSRSNILLKEFDKMSGEWVTRQFTSKTDNAQKIVKLILAGLPLRDGFGANLVLNSSMKVLFRNGYWEFLVEPDDATGVYGRFVHGGTFDSGVMVPWDFPVDHNQEDIDFVKKKYFDDPFDNTEDGLKQNFMRALGRAMAGTPEKITNLVTGPRNCGKSVTLQLTKHCFGGYVACINAGSFQVGKGSSDSTRDYSWGLDCEHARVVFISETVTTDKTGVSELCGNKLKQFQSMKEGAMSGRRLYNDQRNFFSNAKGFLLCNDAPTFKPHDSYKMVHPYVMPNKFVPAEVLDANRHQPTYKLADPRIEQWYKEDRYRDAIIHLILESFHPSEVVPTEGMMEDAEIMEEEVSSDVYDDAFIYTGEISDRVEQKEAKSIINQHIPAAKHSSIAREFITRIRNVNPSFDEKSLKQKSHGTPYYRGVRIRTMMDDQNPQQGGGGSGGYAQGFFPGR